MIMVYLFYLHRVLGLLLVGGGVVFFFFSMFCCLLRHVCEKVAPLLPLQHTLAPRFTRTKMTISIDFHRQLKITHHHCFMH
jgi:hypothetical protein